MNDRTVSEIEEEMEQYQEEGNIGKVMDLVDELGNLDDRLCQACAHADWEKIKYLKSLGLDLTSITFLSPAARFGQVEVIKYLVQHGSDIHAENDHALYAAVTDKQLESVRCLVSLGANVNARNGEIVKIAAENDFLDIVQCLVGAGASIDALLGIRTLEDYHQEVYEWAVAYKQAKDLKEGLEDDLDDGNQITPPRNKV
ncbi:ankyrin repeat domain-containing protein [Burkholderia cepacia]|uniref:ankyrin repeat domain-containing protein n=1 Tax=Burkholderia cepacia TaxID=292 RepID=UPI001CF35C38|nr:ankyrin repeat domain-containing protein [Burkholderia cepacia]MCA8354185.1 ankyrin repeat domain-containing protein [Burkholderia cepacia]